MTGFAHGCSGRSGSRGGAWLRRARADGGEREGGEKGVRELPCYLAKLRGGELVEEERRIGGSTELSGSKWRRARLGFCAKRLRVEGGYKTGPAALK